MSIASDSAEQVIKIVLEGEEICLKATGKAATEILKYIAVIAKNQEKTKGKTRLTNLIKSGKQLDIFGIRQEDLKKFITEAKRYGILYSVLLDKQNKNGNIDIVVRGEDSPRVNRIVQRFKIATVNETQINSMDKELNTIPLLEEKVIKNQLKNSSTILGNQEDNIIKKKDSVKKELNEIKELLSKEHNKRKLSKNKKKEKVI